MTTAEIFPVRRNAPEPTFPIRAADVLQTFAAPAQQNSAISDNDAQSWNQ
jgi:hypothetical protein